MKKITLFLITVGIAFGFSACSKDDDNNSGDNNTPQVNCKLKSLKETIKEGTATKYGGFVMYYDANDVVTRANFIDSTTGNEDSTSYALLSYSGNNLTDVKIFQQGTELINFAMTYSSQDRVEQRFYDVETPFGLAKVSQTYFYDNQGRISYAISRTEIDNVPLAGKVISKDSAVYQNYNSFNRPGGIIVYNTTTSNQGTQPYEFSEEFKYEYDAKGNRTKTSVKEDISDPFETTYSATFDLTKTPGEAEPAYRLITKLFVDDWDDPNINSDDIDINLITSETETEDGVSTTTNTTYTYNDRGNPKQAVEKGISSSTVIDYAYECK